MDGSSDEMPTRRTNDLDLFGPDSDDESEADDDDFVDALADQNIAVMSKLANVVDHLSHATQHPFEPSTSHTNVHNLDQFDSTDPKKLRTFLVQLELCFQDCPRAFRLDRAKITYAQSYLKGMAFEWFEPDLLRDANPFDQP